jgi:hypothetical protein
MSTWFEFDMEALNAPFLTNFDRLFLVQHFRGKAHELQVSSSGGQAQNASAKL